MAAYNSTPNGGLGGFWDGGGGPSVDAQGNMYFQTGNGTFDGGATVTPTNDYAMSVVKLQTTNGLTMVITSRRPTRFPSAAGTRTLAWPLR